MRKIVRKIFLPTMLGATLLSSLTGCGKEEKLITEEVTTKKITTEEINVSEDIELGISDEEYIKNQISDIAEKSYTEYRQFYDALSISKEEVVIMGNVIHGYYDGYSQDQIDDALALINHIYFPQNFEQLLDNCNTRKYKDYAPIDADNIVDNMKVLPYPSIAEFYLEDSEDKNIIIAYEQARNDIVNEITSTKTYSDSTVQKINNMVIEQEKNGYISESYPVVAAQYQLCNFCQFVNPTTSVITDSNDTEYQLSSKGTINDEGYIESDIEAQYYTLVLNGEEVPEDLLSKFNEINDKLIYTKYDNKMVEIEKSIKNNAAASYVAQTNELSEEENKRLTQETYEKYKDYYDSISASEQDISIMIDVINGDVSNYSKDEINSGSKLAKDILFPEKLKNAINDCNDNKKVNYSQTDANIPKITPLLVNHEYTDNLESYESRRDEIAKELADTGAYSDSIKNKINDSIIEQETKDFDEYTDYLESSFSNEGPESILMAAILQNCAMGTLVNPGEPFIKGKDGYDYQISPRTDMNERGYIEQEVIDKYNELKNNGEEVPDDILEEYAIIQMELISSKYEQQYNEYLKLLLTKAGYTDTSMLELYKQKKALLSLLEQRLFNREMEDILSDNKILCEYKITM